MDPNILTLSLGKWMALPGLPYKNRDGMEKRASAINVAKYYENYVNEMGLSNNFKCGVIVTKVIKLNEDVTMTELNDQLSDERVIDDKKFNEILLLSESKETEEIKPEKTCKISSAFNFIISRAQQRYKSEKCCKRRRENALKHDQSPNRKVREVSDHGEIIKLHDFVTNRPHKKLINFNRFRCKERSISLCSDSSNFYDFYECDNLNQYSRSLNNKCINYNIKSDWYADEVPAAVTSSLKLNKESANWYVEAYDMKTRTQIRFTCNSLVLANGSSDLPNKLEISNNIIDPDWLLYDVRSLEIELDLYMQQTTDNINPVIIVGAGLSAADAVITARARNVPVIHVFRNRTTDLSKQLPENMYPEYHKVSHIIFSLLN